MPPRSAAQHAPRLRPTGASLRAGLASLSTACSLLRAALASLLAAVACLATVAAPARGQVPVLPPHFEDVVLPDNFILLADLVFAPDGTLFVVQKQGRVRVYDAAGQLRSAALIDLSFEVNNDHDRGMLALALHPDWVPDDGATSWVYLLYTVSPVPGEDPDYNEDDQYSFSRLTRYRTVINGQGDVIALPDSRQVLIGHQLPDGTVPDGIASMHHSHACGTLLFGRDGTLLVSTGDGAHYDFMDAGGQDEAGFDDFVHPVTGLRGPTPAAQDVGAFRAQQLDSLAGKVLRIDPETGLGLPSNPFYDGDPASLRSRVWALGLRNPFKVTLAPGTGSTNPAQGRPGLLYIGDVGWDLREDFNISRGGENFGWPCFEGFPVSPPYQAATSDVPGFPGCDTTPEGRLTPPALSWHHGSAALLEPAGLHLGADGLPGPGFIGSCSMVGPVYTGTSFPAEYHGRLFLFDYAHRWLRTAELAPNGTLVAVRDFGFGLASPTDMALHPITGELYYSDIIGQRIHRIRHGVNLTPVPVPVALTPKAGPLPLTVAWSALESTDPENDPLTHAWDFGDGTPPVDGAEVQHTWTRAGVYEVRLTTTDSFGLSATSAPVLVTAGDEAPVPQILSPIAGTLFQAPTLMPLSGTATDPDGDAIAGLQWTMDLFHNTHVHPGSFFSTAPQDELLLDLHGDGSALVYHRIELAAADTLGAVGRTHLFVYNEHDVQDLTGQMLPSASPDLLTPPGSQGPGQKDLEIVRDGKFPPPGSTDALAQYETLHPDSDPDDVWIGYELLALPSPEQRFISLTFQEGLHREDGGWFRDFRVEVRSDGVWTEAANLVVVPAYPFELAHEPGFDGRGFDTYALHFDPVHGDAIRLRGAPGGSGAYASCAELRVQLVRIAPVIPVRDITDGATDILAHVLELSPPGSQGSGNPDPQVLRDGTLPPVGSTSLIGQFDTQHSGEPPALDWIGYAFPIPRLISGLVYQEGLDRPSGGAFVAGTLRVELRGGPDEPWVPATELLVSPPHDGPDGISYQAHVLSFAPTQATQVRIAGEPSGWRRFISAGELRVLSPAVPPGSAPKPYGTQHGGANTLLLEAPDPAFFGLPFVLRASGAEGPALGGLMLATAPASKPFQGGTFLLSGLLVQLPIAFDASGTLLLSAALPTLPALAGLNVYAQAFAFSQPLPWQIRLSNGVQFTISPAP